jgi:hypothetical protein
MVSVRPYISEGLKVYEDIIRRKKWEDRVFVDSSVMFADWVMKQNVLITEYSSTFLEAYIAKVPTINLDKIIRRNSKGLAYDWEDQPDYQYFQTALESFLSSNSPNTYQELIKMLVKKIKPVKKNKLIEKHLNELHNWNFPQASTNLVSEIIKTEVLKSKFFNNFYVPKVFLELVDMISFSRAEKINPEHSSFNYYKKIHKIPEFYHDIVSEMLK